MGAPEKEERYKEAESLFQEIIVENFPNPCTEIEIHIQKAQLKPNNECFGNKKDQNILL